MSFFVPSSHNATSERNKALSQWLVAQPSQPEPCWVILSPLCGYSKFYPEGLQGWVKEQMDRTKVKGK